VTATATLRIGTRASRLARAQADLAIKALAPTSTGPIEVVPITTDGDVISANRASGGWIAGDGQFTRELERALLDRRVDLVVHSFKDLPTEPNDELVIAAVLVRGDPRDCMLTPDASGIDGAPFGGRIGTSSTRRAAQLAAARSDLIAIPIRGNVESRLRRLHAGEYDGLLLAAAGLDRLGIEAGPRARLPLDVMLPAPAQGALALQVRAGDAGLRRLLASVNHAPTRIAVEAERALLRTLGGGCLAPLGALGEVNGSTLRLRAAYEDRGGTLVRAESTGRASDGAAVAVDVARRISAEAQL
jgi:hydroxymethylbilane synthase